MRKHVFALILVLSIVLLLVPFTISCVPPAATATAPTDGIAYKSDIAALQSQVSGKADAAALTAQATRIDTIVSQGAGNTYSKDQLYTKTEVDAKIAAAIAALKADQTWITGTSTGGTTSSTATGLVIFTTNPVSIPQIFSSSSGGSSSPWIMTISNQSTTWQYVKPVLNLNVASGQPSSVVTAITVMTSGGACSMTGTYPGTPNNFSFSPTTMNVITTPTPSIVVIPISGCNGSGEIQVGPGTQQAFNIQIQGLTTPNPILWNINCSISSRSM